VARPHAWLRAARKNQALAWAMDRGETVAARISRLRQHPNPRLRLEFEVFVA
jgi:hypothetical protein